MSASNGLRYRAQSPFAFRPAAALAKWEIMMKVSEVMTRRVVSISPEATIFEAVRLMLKHHISGLPVVAAKGKLVGIVTESDFLHRPETGTERKRSRWLDALFGPAA